MTDQLKTLAVHAGCVLAICVCFALGELSPLRAALVAGVPVFSLALEAAGFWLWGKLGFKPAAIILDRILQRMEPARVEQIMSQRPPAPPPAGATP